ncbi:heterokaryon incompatibility protein-domain-containing protein [Daedaleopsis nitida]|nr:heterokaryon incompatibility protein-domain-containing protein [Daedaleopsis nitida]
MWLLHTHTAELHYFNQPPSRYAILSHVWDSDEKSFQDIQALRLTIAQDGDDPRARAPAKIRLCCIRAERDGFEWLWVDTCCIDKTSSAELSEAINSMYQWYKKAAICYVYLGDVSCEQNPKDPDSQFRRSRWFTRGWTLQELIAPDRAIFLSREWVVLGQKSTFALLLHEITNIDVGVLTFQVSLVDVPVARRMHWASARETTRVEDEAYSLMGIFGVNMPTIYGEGRKAFRRLQEEIMKSVADHTLFTWGPGLPLHSCGDGVLCLPFNDSIGLLARSPADFRLYGGIAKTELGNYQWALRRFARELLESSSREPESEFEQGVHDVVTNGEGPESASDTPEFTMTSYGIRARLPIVELSLSTNPEEHDGRLRCVALLACSYDSDSHQFGYVGLLLHQVEYSSALYGVGCAIKASGAVARWVYFDSASDPLTRFLHAPKARQSVDMWRNIYIVPDVWRSNRPRGSTKYRSDRCSVEVFIGAWTTARLALYGFEPTESSFQDNRQLFATSPHQDWLRVWQRSLLASPLPFPTFQPEAQHRDRDLNLLHGSLNYAYKHSTLPIEIHIGVHRPRFKYHRSQAFESDASPVCAYSYHVLPYRGDGAWSRPPSVSAVYIGNAKIERTEGCSWAGALQIEAQLIPWSPADTGEQVLEVDIQLSGWDLGRELPVTTGFHRQWTTIISSPGTAYS